MTPLRTLAHRYLRIDPRSLGAFRILFGLTLLADWCHRWRWLTAFYSNEGVLPNHNHLFHLRDGGRVWSALHAFSQRDEAIAFFGVALVFYLLFTVGLFTRVATVAAAIAFVSMTGRNILLESPGDALAVSLLLFGVLLPLDARFSLDALRRSFAIREEHGVSDLNDRSSPSPIEVGASLSAFGMLLVVGLVPLAAALQQKGGAWARGDALYYALHTDRWLTGFGEAVRSKVPLGLLAAWTKAWRSAEFAVLPLALVPVARRFVRPIAMAALALVGFTYWACFDLGAYGSAMLAAVPLLAPEELWEAARKSPSPIRVVYDEDCGICFWLARLLKRLDRRENVTFLGNGAIARGEVDPLPEGVTPEVADRTIVVIDAAGTAHLDAHAVARILRALPLLGWLGRLVALPGVNALVRRLYYRVAENRLDISVACGLGACGLPVVGATADAKEGEATVAPATLAWRLAKGAGDTAAAGFLLATFLSATEASNDLPWKTGLGNRDVLRGAASYTRISAGWGVFAPEPPTRNEAIVAIGTTRDDVEIDVLTGLAPDPDLTIPARHRLGPLWATYSERVQRDETTSFRQELRRYLMRGGRIADDKDAPAGLTKVKTTWVSVPIAPPGGTAEGETERNEFLDNPVHPRSSSDGERSPRPRHNLAPSR